MNPEKFNGNVDFNQDDEQDWGKIMGAEKTDEIDKINAEEEQEFKDLYPGEYENKEEDIEVEVKQDAATPENLEKAA